MVFTCIVAAAFIAAVGASGYAPSAPVYYAEPVEELDSHPQYTYTYGVNDVVSGDSKSQVEGRNGPVGHGEYPLVNADGYKRIVKYTPDDIIQFNAAVYRQPIEKTVAAPVIVTAPTVVKSIAPVTYTAPSLVKSTPITYGAPTIIKQTPLTYAAPIFIKTIPTSYETRSISKPTSTYSAGSPHLAYNAAVPTLVQNPPIVYSAPVAYTRRTLVKSAPAAYGAW